MAYSSGGTIEAVDYNNRVATINSIWGVGTGDRGYGQSTTLSSVATGNTVTATQWSDLITRIDSLRNHQNSGTPGSGITKPIAGGIITYLSALDTQITNVESNRLQNLGDGFGINIVTGTSSFNSVITTWNSTRTQEISLTWGSYNQMRYFFNTGGYVSATVSGGTFSGNTKSVDWENLTNAFGTIRLFGQTTTKVGGSGTLSIAPAADFGFYDLTDTHVTYYRQISTLAPYSTAQNRIDLQWRLNVPHASSPTTLFIRFVYTDAEIDIVDDNVLGTAQIAVQAVPSGVTFIANTWGGVTGASVTDSAV